MNISSFSHPDWTNQWAGTWSILSFSYWGSFYCRQPFSPYIDHYADQAIIIWKQDRSSAYQRRSIKQAFGQNIEKIIQSRPDFPEKINRELKSATDEFLHYTAQHLGDDLSYEQYRQFQHLLIDQYYPLHVMVKVSVDFFQPQTLARYLPVFEEARVYAEPVFSKSEEFMRSLAQLHSKKTRLAPELILCALNHEFESYLRDGHNLPEEKILAERHQGVALLFSTTETKLLTGKDVRTIEQIVHQGDQDEVIRGAIAYPGKVQGRARVISDPRKPGDFREGDILVSGMTRPEFLPLMQKAAGFVTDGGGILCHAAIVAREMHKPCVIGTMTATKKIHDGDIIEVDADHGTVKVIRKNGST